MLPEFARAVDETEPLSFVCENVPALAGPKFAPYLRKSFLEPLSWSYHVTMFKLSAHDYGVPQLRHRIFFVGFRRVEHARRFAPPDATHRADHLARGPQAPATARPLRTTMGAREALGLLKSNIDGLAPTLRSTLTGPRHTTSILSSVSAQRSWKLTSGGVSRTPPPPSSCIARRTMEATRRTDTTPERLLRSELHARGLRYRKDCRIDAAGRRVRPDLLFGPARVAVFVDGCFWHRCPLHATRPAANAEYWQAKLDRNVERDRADDAALESAGWAVVRAWEHEDPPTPRIASR